MVASISVRQHVVHLETATDCARFAKRALSIQSRRFQLIIVVWFIAGDERGHFAVPRRLVVRRLFFQTSISLVSIIDTSRWVWHILLSEHSV